MREIRSAVGAAPVTFIIDTNHAYGVADAIRLGRALDDYRPSLVPTERIFE